MATKKVIYTCITGRYDELQDHRYRHPDWDYICFSNDDIANAKNTSWKIKPLVYDKQDNTRNERWHKVNPHKILREYENSVYLDANVEITHKDFFEVIEGCMNNDVNLAFPLHPKRDCIYEEIKACIAQNKDESSVMLEQIELAKLAGYPEHAGLYAGTIIYRRHNQDIVKKIMNEWWLMVKHHSKRDQLSLPFVLWQNNYKPAILPFKVYDEKDKRLKYWPHNNEARAVIDNLANQLKMCQEEIETLTQMNNSRLTNKLKRYINRNV